MIQLYGMADDRRQVSCGQPRLPAVPAPVPINLSMPMTVKFHSTLDDPAKWVPRLLEVAVAWIPPEGGLAAFTGLRVVQSLGAGIYQLGMQGFLLRCASRGWSIAV